MSTAIGVDVVDYVVNRFKPELYTSGYKNVVRFTPRPVPAGTTPGQPTTTTDKAA
jgi:hypothetical protein